jgi:hypothetical protein
MRKASILVGLTLIALGAVARAQDKAPATAAAPLPDAAPAGAAVASPPAATVGTPPPVVSDAPPPRWIELGLSFLPMGRGSISSPGSGTMDVSGDARLAYGVGLWGTFPVIAGLRVGLAPQAIYDVSYKVNPAGNGIPLPAASTEYDILARLEYEFPLVDGITLYADALPGYSLILNPGRGTAKGAVLALGGGAFMDMSDRFFLNLGAGYQFGFQSLTIEGTMVRNYRTQYLRAVLGVGYRF